MSEGDSLCLTSHQYLRSYGDWNTAYRPDQSIRSASKLRLSLHMMSGGARDQTQDPRVQGE